MKSYMLPVLSAKKEKQNNNQYVFQSLQGSQTGRNLVTKDTASENASKEGSVFKTIEHLGPNGEAQDSIHQSQTQVSSSRRQPIQYASTHSNQARIEASQWIGEAKLSGPLISRNGGNPVPMSTMTPGRKGLKLKVGFENLSLLQQHDLIQLESHRVYLEQKKMKDGENRGCMSPAFQTFFPLSIQAQTKLPYEMIESLFLRSPESQTARRADSLKSHNRYTMFNNRKISKYSQEVTRSNLAVKTQGKLLSSTLQSLTSSRQDPFISQTKKPERVSMNGTSTQFVHMAKQTAQINNSEKAKPIISRWKGSNSAQRNLNRFNRKAQELGIKLKSTEKIENLFKEEITHGETNIRYPRDPYKLPVYESIDSSVFVEKPLDLRQKVDKVMQNQHQQLAHRISIPKSNEGAFRQQNYSTNISQHINSSYYQHNTSSSPLSQGKSSPGVYIEPGFRAEGATSAWRTHETRKFAKEESQIVEKGFTGIPVLSARAFTGAPNLNALRQTFDQPACLTPSNFEVFSFQSSQKAMGQQNANPHRGRGFGLGESSFGSRAPEQFGRYEPKHIYKSPVAAKRQVLFKAHSRHSPQKLSAILVPRQVLSQYQNYPIQNQEERGESSPKNLVTVGSDYHLEKSKARLNESPKTNRNKCDASQIAQVLPQTKDPIDKYHFSEGYEEVLEQLAQARADRLGDGNAVNQHISQIVSKLQATGSNKSKQELKLTILSYMDRRALQEAASNAHRPPEEKHNCKIAQKSMNFMTSIQGRGRPLQEKPCQHGKPDEEMQQIFLKDYERFSFFSEQLKNKLKERITNEQLVQSIMSDIEGLRLSKQERAIFSSDEAVQSFLNNPELEIALSAKELEDIEQGQRRLKAGKTLQRRATQISSKNQLTATPAAIEILMLVTKRIVEEKVAQLFIKKKRLIQHRMSTKKLLKTSGSTLEQAGPAIEKFKKDLLLQNQQQLYRESLVDISGKEQNVEELDEDEKYNRQYMVSEIDQNIEERATKLIKQLQTEVERRDEETSDILQEQNKLAEQIAEADGEAPEFLDEDQGNVFKNLDENTLFYQQAKDEVQGFNRQTNQQSEFYKLCQANDLLPQPLFRCISQNELCFAGRLLSQRQAAVLAEFLRRNLNPEMQIMRLQLDNCSLRDAGFANLLAGIFKSRLGSGLLSISYSNNELGTAGVAGICDFLKMSFRSSSRSLKELSLCNVSVKKTEDLRVLTSCLASCGKHLRKLKIQQVNLNDVEIVDNLCRLLHENKSLKILQLAACKLTPGQLVKVVKELQVFKGQSVLGELDLSGHAIAPGADGNSARQACFLACLADFIMESPSICSINLEGSQLGKKLVPFVKYISGSKHLIQLNLINNGLTVGDEVLIRHALGIRSDSLASKGSNMLQLLDREFLTRMNQFKRTHMIEDNSFNQASEIISQFVNQGLVKQLRNANSLDSNIKLSTKVEQALTSTGGDSIQTRYHSGKICDQLVLTRMVGYNDFVYNELGQDNLSVTNFLKPFAWKESSGGVDVSKQRYVMVHVNLDTIEQEYKLVADEQTIALLKAQYGITDVDTSKHEGRQHPLVFGTFTKWRAYQMLPPYEVAAALICEKVEEREQLVNTLLDTKNYEVKKFKLFCKHIHNLLDSAVQAQRGQIVGDYKYDPARPALRIETDFIYTQLVEPGKHSAYIYNPNDDCFYKRLIAVELQDRPVNRRKVCADLSFLEVKNAPIIENPALKRDMLISGFIRDLSIAGKDFRQGLDGFLGEAVHKLLSTVFKHYEQLTELFLVLQSQSMPSFPRISFAQAEAALKKISQAPFQNERLSQIFLEEPLLTQSHFISLLLQFFTGTSESTSPEAFEKFLSQFLAANLDQLREQDRPFVLRKQFLSDKHVQGVMELNEDKVRHFLEIRSKLYIFTPALIHEYLNSSCQIKISLDEVYRFCGLSRRSCDSLEPSKDLDFQEFCELVYRVAIHLCSPETYNHIDSTGEPVSIDPAFKDLLEESNHVKFKFVLQKIIQSEPDLPDSTLRAVPEEGGFNQVKENELACLIEELSVHLPNDESRQLFKDLAAGK